MKKGSIAGNIGAVIVMATMFTSCATFEKYGISKDNAYLKKVVITSVKAAAVKEGIPADAVPDEMISDLYDTIIQLPELAAIAIEAEKNETIVAKLTELIEKYLKELTPAVLTHQPASPLQPPTLTGGAE
jgi:hypothetical protein